MSPSDVAGVFSRYFIVGFFLPAFFALAIVAFGLSSDAVPNQFESYGDGAKIAIVGGAAVLLGLALLGVGRINRSRVALGRATGRPVRASSGSLPRPWLPIGG